MGETAVERHHAGALATQRGQCSLADATARCLGYAGTNTSLHISNGAVRLRLPPLGAAVYELKPR